MSSIDDRPSCTDACPQLLNRPTFFIYLPSASMTYVNTTKFCAELVKVARCRYSCTFGNDPRKLFSWINSICGGDEAYERESWREMTLANEVAWVSQWIPALFPWNWTVRVAQPATPAKMGIQITDPITSSMPYLSVPPSGPGVCKTSTSEKLGVFAAVNIASAVLLPILGRRTVVSKLTFGHFGKLGSHGWPMMGVFSAALNVLANLVNAHLIHSTPGYEDVPIGALALLWCTRPRLAWLAVFLAAIQPAEGMYLNCAASAITSETILQVLGAVYFGISANYARKKGFYYTGRLYPYPRGKDAHIMYAGALLWLLMSFITLGACQRCIEGLGEVIANARRMVERVQNVAAASENVVAGPWSWFNPSGPFRSWFDRDSGPSEEWAPEWLRRYFDKQHDDATQAGPPRLTAEEIRRTVDIFNAVIIFVFFLAQ